jgi:hypothetical protein
MPLHGITHGPEQERGACELQKRASHAQYPEQRKGCKDEQHKPDPAHHARLPFRRLSASRAPRDSNRMGAAHSGHAAGSLVGR